MGRHFSLCVFLILFALLASIIEASGVGGSSSGAGSSSGGGGFGARISQAFSKLKDDVMSIVTSTFYDVVYSEIEDEKGVLTNEAVGPDMDDLMYRFYPARSLGKKGDTKGAKAAVEFRINDITWVSCNGKVAYFKRGSEKVYSFKFTSANDARAFAAQQTHLG